MKKVNVKFKAASKTVDEFPRQRATVAKTAEVSDKSKKTPSKSNGKPVNRIASIPGGTPEELCQKIQAKAYELYEQRGGNHGQDWADWFEAERLVKS